MAINKKLIHFKTFANFNSQKLSANEANTKYTTGISGTETSGNPDILYQSICFIKDTQQIWTHGQIYNASADGSGVIIKFNQVFEDGKSVTSNETNLFDKVLEASNANVPVFFHDTNSPILISSYPMSIGNQIVASGARGAATYNFVIVSGSNSVSISTVDYVTSLDDVVTSDQIPTKTSDLTNDSGFITANDNVASATKLQTMRYINGSPFDGTTNVVSYAVCATGASTTAKTVSISRFSLATGSQVRVKFSNANTASAPTLNVGSTGAKRMSYKGSLITNTNFTFNTNKIYTFTYDGTYWVLEGDWDEVPKTNFLTCEFMGEVGDVIWSSINTDRIAIIHDWMNKLSEGKVSILESDEDIYAITYALNYSSDETYGSDKARFSYIFEGYLYDVEYESVSLPVTLTIVNKTKIESGGGSAEPMICAYTIGSYTARTIELINHTYNGQTMDYREGAIISILNPNSADIVFVGGTVTLDGNAYEAEAFTIKSGATVLFALGPDSGIMLPISSAENNAADIVNYGTCSTAAATIAKTISITGFNLVTGARVSVNFTNGNTAASMTLNVSSTGAKSVVYRGSTNTPTLDAGTYDFIYTGSQWELLSTKGINKFTINRASYTGVVYPDSFIRFYYSTGVTTLNVSSTTTTSAFDVYSFEFNSGNTPTVFTYPSSWKWAKGSIPTINANKTYHVSVVNNCAIIAEF